VADGILHGTEVHGNVGGVCDQAAARVEEGWQAYVSMRQHTAGIRQHTSAYGRHTSGYVSIRQAYVRIRQHTSFATKPPPDSKRAGRRDSVSICTFVLVKQVNFGFTAGKV
jgi:hypothetical protein